VDYFKPQVSPNPSDPEKIWRMEGKGVKREKMRIITTG